MNNKYSIGTFYHGNNVEFLNNVIPFISHLALSTDLILNSCNSPDFLKRKIINELFVLDESIELQVTGSGLAIGSYDGYADEYIKLLDELFYILPVKSHSESIAYTMVNNNSPGDMLTLPKTDKALEIICRRIDFIQKKFKIPFLLENSRSFNFPVTSNYTDAQFLNLISQKTGCGLILDIFNLECSTNYNSMMVYDFINELNINYIFKVHLTGRFQEVPFQNSLNINNNVSSCLQVLDLVLKRLPENLKSVTYEVNDNLLSKGGIKNVIRQLSLLNSIVNTPHNAFCPISNHFIIPDQLEAN